MFDYCNGEYYRMDCFASMIYSFGGGKEGLKLMQDWIDEYTGGLWFHVIFYWLLYDLIWIPTFWALLLDPKALPPA